MIASAARTCDGLLLTVCLQAALAWMEQHRDTINTMNVFPVPDGDTGTNMWHTLRSAYASIRDAANPHVGQVSDALARGALRGARGNSGTILSMLLRGFANGLTDVSEMDAALLRTAARCAVDYAYDTVRTVMSPVEGTILTVARVAAEQAAASPHEDLLVQFGHLVSGARAGLAMTPELLPVLKEAGVVDSGGYGLVTLLEGVQRFLNGQPLAEPAPPPEAALSAPPPDDSEGYGYDVQFLMLGEDLPLARIRQDISAMGWSPLVDGDARMVRVHVHVHNPADPIAYAIGLGAELDDIVVENMQQQYRARHGGRPPAALSDTVAVVVVAAGEGVKRLLLEYGAQAIVHGGQTMNPSVEDFVQAIRTTDARAVIVLPNNPNLILTAEQAAQLLPERRLHVVHTLTVPQGMAALLAYLDAQGSPVDTLAQRMAAAATQVTTLEVTTASRDVPEQGIACGDWLGLHNGVPATHGGDLLAVTLRLMAAAGAADRELITVLAGADLSAADAAQLQQWLRAAYPDQTLEWLEGGQPLYPLVISLE